MNPDLVAVLVDDLGLRPDTLVPDARVSDVGVDSLGLVEISVAVSQRWQVEISEATLATAATLDDLDDLLSPLIAGAKETS